MLLYYAAAFLDDSKHHSERELGIARLTCVIHTVYGISECRYNSGTVDWTPGLNSTSTSTVTSTSTYVAVQASNVT